MDAARSPAGPSAEQAFLRIVAGDVTGAIAIYRELLKRAPRSREIHLWLGQALLMSGDFAQGWEECEWRPQQAMPPSMRRWRGAALNGERIFVVGEQGFGDNLQFVRYAPLVAARGGKVVVGTRKGLGVLLRTAPGVAAVIETGDPMDAIPWTIPMLSLPYVLATRLDTIPATVPYLTADPARVARWRERLAGPARLKVGLVWSGNTDAVYNARRSPGFDALRPLLDLPGVAFHVLQMGGGRKDIEGATLPANVTDLGPELGDFADTAAAMMNLDLIVSPCTSTAHLAGALARPVWIMLGADPDWRWLTGRADSPWYPTARLFHQSRPGEWGDEIARLRAALAERASAI